MKFNNRIYSSVDDFNHLIQELKNFDVELLTTQMIEELVYIMKHTEYTNLRGRVAIFLSRTNMSSVLSEFIYLIKENIHTNYIGSLIYACSQFDCSMYIELFVDIIILKDDMTVLDAFSVIENIKEPVDPFTKKYCINKLKAFNELLEEDFHKFKTITQTIELINTLS